MVILTSFKKAADNTLAAHTGLHVYSIACHQPRGTNYDELRFLAPIDRHGHDIRLSRIVDLSTPARFEETLSSLRLNLADAFMSRLDEIRHWAETLDDKTTTVLCSWPPYSKAAQKQLAEFGLFTCHSSAVVEVIKLLRPEVKVVMDRDRREHLANLQAACAR